MQEPERRKSVGAFGTHVCVMSSYHQTGALRAHAGVASPCLSRPNQSYSKVFKANQGFLEKKCVGGGCAMGARN